MSPVFGNGYVIASKEFVDEASKIRRYADRQDDTLLELSFADFIKLGDVDRHIREVMKIHKYRRDLFCKLLKDELVSVFEFEIPKGGMAVCAKMHTEYT